MKLRSFWSKQVVVFTLRGYKAINHFCLRKKKERKKKRQEERKEEKKKEGKREKLFSAQMHTFLILQFNPSQVQHQYGDPILINQILHLNPAVPLTLFKMLDLTFYANLNLVKKF